MSSEQAASGQSIRGAKSEKAEATWDGDQGKADYENKIASGQKVRRAAQEAEHADELTGLLAVWEKGKFGSKGESFMDQHSQSY